MRRMFKKSNLYLFVFLILGFAFSCKKDKQNTVTDIDGNVYHTIQIGSQTWMVENLKVTKLNDGTPLAWAKSDADWDANKQVATYRWQADDVKSKNPYGAFYNLTAVQSGKLAPKGWHIPADTEWGALATALGGASIAGGKMKEVGNSHWAGANTGATNESGFTAVPAGICSSLGFSYFGGQAAFYVADQQQAGVIDLYQLGSSNTNLAKNSFSDDIGVSVRCIKD